MRKAFRVLDRGAAILFIVDLANAMALDSESSAPMVVMMVISAILLAYLLIRLPYQAKLERRERRRSQRELTNTLNKHGQ